MGRHDGVLQDVRRGAGPRVVDVGEEDAQGHSMPG